MLARTEQLTIKQIVGAVAKSGALIQAEADMQSAAAAHKAAVDAIRAEIAANSDQRNAAKVNACAAAEAQAERAIRLAREKVTPLRAAHGEKVVATLRPMRQAAAEKIVDILTDLAPELRVLHESMVAVESLGAECVRMPPIDLSHVEHVARRIAGASPVEA